MTQPIVYPDPRDRQQVEEFFAHLKALYPEVVAGLKLMNISCDQYLAVLRATRQATISTSSAGIQL